MKNPVESEANLFIEKHVDESFIGVFQRLSDGVR
jgi:hypothetical protein